MKSIETEKILSSEKYIFAENIVYCINYHFSEDIGRVGPCYNLKTRRTLLTPNLEKLLIKILFYRRKTILKRFHNFFKEKPLTISVFKKDIKECVKRSILNISEWIKNCRQEEYDVFVTMAFFTHCIEAASMAVLFHRGGNAPGSLSYAISFIYSSIKIFQELKYFNADTWVKLPTWGSTFNCSCLNSTLGLEEVYLDENNSTYFKFIEPKTPSNSSVSQTNITSDVNTDPFTNESMTLEEMIRIATHVI